MPQQNVIEIVLRARDQTQGVLTSFRRNLLGLPTLIAGLGSAVAFGKFVKETSDLVSFDYGEDNHEGTAGSIKRFLEISRPFGIDRVAAFNRGAQRVEAGWRVQGVVVATVYRHGEQSGRGEAADRETDDYVRAVEAARSRK